MKSRAVAVSIDGKVEYHVPGIALDYDTLCGLDSSDPVIGHSPATTPKNQKVTCAMCRSMWQNLKELRITEKDFE